MKLLAVALASFALIAVLFVVPKVWWWATHFRVYESVGYSIGWVTYSRLTGEREGETKYWDSRTGMLTTHIIQHRDGTTRGTGWDPHDGRITTQLLENGGERLEPPWSWDEREQEAPSAPWLRLGISAGEWWRRVGIGPEDD